MGKVIFQGQIIAENWVGTGRWELRLPEAVNFGLFCPLRNEMAKHPDGFITDRQTRPACGGFHVTQTQPSGKIFQSLWCLQALPRAGRRDGSGTCALSKGQLDTGLDVPSFALLHLLRKALHS